MGEPGAHGASDGPFRGSASLTDSHCHLTAEAFAEDLAAVLARARDAGVDRIVSIASDPADARAALDLATDTPGVWATVGVHPHAADAHDPASALPLVRALLGRGGAVALGETGLDFHYDFAPRERQLVWFRHHLELADEFGLPLVVHSRNADDDTLKVVQEAGRRGVAGVLHCFTGGDALLDTALAAGWYLGYGGIATFRNFEGGARLARVPEERLLIETDAPYLAPVPHRGRRNEPAFLPRSLQRIAELRDAEPAALARATSANAARLFGLDRPEAA